MVFAFNHFKEEYSEKEIQPSISFIKDFRVKSF